MENELVIRLSMFDRPLVEQLQLQGYAFSRYGLAEGYESLRKSLNDLYFHGMISATERDKIIARITKHLQKDIRRI